MAAVGDPVWIEHEEQVLFASTTHLLRPTPNDLILHHFRAGLGGRVRDRAGRRARGG